MVNTGNDGWRDTVVNAFDLKMFCPAGPVFTNIVLDSDFTYRLRLRFLTVQRRFCDTSKVVFMNVPKSVDFEAS